MKLNLINKLVLISFMYICCSCAQKKGNELTKVFSFQPKVVKLNVEMISGLTGIGCGIQLNNYYVVTVYHNLRNSEEISVESSTCKDINRYRVVRINKRYDLALLELISKETPKYFSWKGGRFGHDNIERRDLKVYLIGRKGNKKYGKVEVFSKNTPLFQIESNKYIAGPGDSGGAVYNFESKLIGMITAADKLGLSVTAIPIGLIEDFLLNEDLSLKIPTHFEDSDTAYMWGELSYRNREIDKAIELYSIAIDINPNNLDAIIMLGIAYEKKGNAENGIRIFQDAIHAFPNNPKGYLALSSALKNSGKCMEGIKVLKKALQFNQKSGAIHFALGEEYKNVKNYESAIFHFKKTNELNPNIKLAYKYLGILLYLKDDYKEAIPIFHKLVKLDPFDASGLCYLGGAYLANDEIDKAIEWLFKGLVLDPSDVDCAEMLLICLELKPNSAQKGIVYLILSWRESKNNDIKTAINFLKKAYKFNKKTILKFENIANIMFKNKNYSGAWKVVQLTRQYGHKLNPKFIKTLHEAMPEP